MIGRVLKKAKPEVYTEIVGMIQPGSEINVQKIYRFYARFDMLKQEGEKIDRCRVFTAAMIKLYYPYMFDKLLTGVGHSFIQVIRTCFEMKQPNVSRLIPEVIVMYKCYSEFKTRVDETLEKIKDGSQDAEQRSE